jgi:hypothetical protein
MSVPEVPWPNVAGRLQRSWQPIEANPHMALFAQTRGGKSHLIRWGILPLVPLARVVVIDVKPGGDLTWDGWGHDTTELAHGFGLSPTGYPRYRIRVQPGADGAAQVRRVLDQLAAEGEVVIVIDDSRRVTGNHAPGLGLGHVVDHLLLEGAGLGVTVILGANSTAWATTSLKDQCGVIWLGHTRTDEQRDKFAELAGLPKAERHVLDTIAPRRWLYTDYAGDGLALALTTPPGAPGAAAAR